LPDNRGNCLLCRGLTPRALAGCALRQHLSTIAAPSTTSQEPQARFVSRSTLGLPIVAARTATLRTSLAALRLGAGTSRLAATRTARGARLAGTARPRLARRAAGAGNAVDGRHRTIGRERSGGLDTARLAVLDGFRAAGLDGARLGAS